MFEKLESRRLMSTGVTFSGGKLSIKGGSHNQVITVTETSPGAVHVETNNAINQYDFVGVTSINIKGGGGADTINYQGISIGAVIDGGGGKGDNITVDDQGTGSSSVNGGGGDDVIIVEHSNNTTVVGGGGKDQFFLNTASDPGQGNNDVVYAFASGGGKDFVGVSAASGTINGAAFTNPNGGNGTAIITIDKQDTVVLA